MSESSSKTTQASNQPMLRIFNSIPKLMLANFLAGVSWGIGSLVGGTVIVALIGFILSRTLELPSIEEFMDATLSELQQTSEESPE